MDEVCPLCRGREILEGRKCKCVLERELRDFLPQYLSGVKLSEYTLKNPDNFKNIGDCLLVFDRGQYYSRLKTYLCMRYLMEGAGFSYRIMTGGDLVREYVTVDLQDISGCVGFVVFEFCGDLLNKAMFQAFDYVVRERRKRGLITWVYVHTAKVEMEKFTKVYGKEMYEFVFETGGFVRLGNK